jgi:voltage-gated potassium channel
MKRRTAAKERTHAVALGGHTTPARALTRDGGTTEMSTARAVARERLQILRQVEDWLEVPMIVLGFVWLLLLVVELIRGLGPTLDAVGTTIWVVFVFDFLLRFALAPRKVRYLRSNWLTAISLILPALRVFRVLRLLRMARAARGLRLVRVLGSLNRGMRATRASLGRRGFGYVLALTLMVVAVGAAAMYAFERGVAGGALRTYGDALWWTTMILTTLGSEYWPRSPEGRVLCVLLSLYGLAMLGYITASFAALFVGRDAESAAGEVAGAREVAALQAEVRALRAELRDALRR